MTRAQQAALTAIRTGELYVGRDPAAPWSGTAFASRTLRALSAQGLIARGPYVPMRGHRLTVTEDGAAAPPGAPTNAGGVRLRPVTTDACVLVEVTRYEVSLLAADDTNRKYFTLLVDRTRRGMWIVHDGHGGYDIDGNWTPGRTGAHEFADADDACALAQQLAPNLTVNGHTATEAYQQTHGLNSNSAPEAGGTR